MNNIYEQKAKKYKYKYLKLKRLKNELEYIGELEGGIDYNYDNKIKILIDEKFDQLSNEKKEQILINEIEKLSNEEIEQILNKEIEQLPKKNNNLSYFYNFNRIGLELNLFNKNGLNKKIYKEIKKRLENEKLENEKLENERLKRLENERLENERLEKLESERLENERLENERLENERLENERLEKLESEKLENERLEKLEDTDFKEKIKNLKKAINEDIKLLYDKKKIIGNINKDIFNNNNVNLNINEPIEIKDWNINSINSINSNISKIKSDVLKCFIDLKKNAITREQLINCKIDEDEINNLLTKIKTEDEKIKNKGNFNYDHKYIFDRNYINNEIIIKIVRNIDLYTINDIIYDLYKNLNNNLKIKYESLFNNENKINLNYTPDDLINRLEQILNI
jgi:hypothetical protein